MSDIVIKVENLSKRYRIGAIQGYKTFREDIVDMTTAPFRRLRRAFSHQLSPTSYDPSTISHELSAMKYQPSAISHQQSPNNYIWALKDVSFEVKKGEVVGIIGRNGAGKTTLLKILTRITEPTEGYAEIKGRVGSLLEVGTGFHPELTGRENIFLNGAILGMKRAEIKKKFDEIVAFAEIEKFIDTPVKRYSSGMYVRLAFAVAAHLEPEILLVDEVLAVGDAAFQKKCLGKMGDVAKKGRTVLFVSHNMGAINRLCQRVFWLDNGQLKLDGVSSEVVGRYLLAGVSVNGVWKRDTDTNYTKEPRLLSAYVVSDGNAPVAVVNFKKPFKIIVEYDIKKSIQNMAIVVRLADALGNVIFTSWDTDTTDLRNNYRKPGVYRSICEIPSHLLRPGRYLISIGSHIYNVKIIEFLENALRFEVSSADFPLNENRIGIITPFLKWSWESIKP